MGEVMEGRAAIEKNMRMMFSSTTKRTTHKLTIERVYSVSPFIAVADGIAEVSAAHDVWKSQFTAIFSKLNDDDWKIEHMRSYVFSK
jgi:ketosteroid isomerase-like protein